LDAKLNKNQVREAYRKHASTYDIWSSLTESKARQRCLEVADIKNGESVLEVAVGTGHMSHLLNRVKSMKRLPHLMNFIQSAKLVHHKILPM